MLRQIKNVTRTGAVLNVKIFEPNDRINTLSGGWLGLSSSGILISNTTPDTYTSSSGTVTFQKAFSGLQAGARYVYDFPFRDDAGHTITVTGSFMTASAPIVFSG